MKKGKLSICLLLLIVIMGCSKDDNSIYPEEELFSTMKIGSVTPSLLSDDHTAEGFLVSIPSGRVWHFFRLDPGQVGDHVGIGGAIYKRYSDDYGLTWSTPELIIDDPDYDDRNVAGGMTDDGKIIIFYRRYNVSLRKSVDVNYLVSSDFGETFSSRRVILGFAKRPMNFVSAGGGKYIVPLFEDGYKAEIRSFTMNGDEVVFSDNAWEFEDNGAGFTEPAVCVDGNKLLVVFRSDFKEGVYQSYSLDGGITFSNPQKTNMIDEFKVSLPLLIYDRRFADNLFCIIGDRGPDKLNAKLWIYNNNVNDAISDAFSFLNFTSIIRPAPTETRVFYGYPTATLMKNGSYLVVFTESETEDNGTEDADFYQFTLMPEKL